MNLLGRIEGIGVVVALLVVLFFSSVDAETLATPDDGKYYLGAMKIAIMEVATERQVLINQKSDGTIKFEQLTAEGIYLKAYGNFKRISGGVTIESLAGEHNPERVAHLLAVQLQSIRMTIAQSQEMINAGAAGASNLKKFVPAVFGKLVSEKMQAQTGVALKQTTLGKGKYKARAEYNQPDEWEVGALNKVAGESWPHDAGVGEHVYNRYRYLKPIYIQTACLVCHGFPEGEKGPYGHPKEGYKVGDVRGGISVTLPLK